MHVMWSLRYFELSFFYLECVCVAYFSVFFFKFKHKRQSRMRSSIRNNEKMKWTWTKKTAWNTNNKKYPTKPMLKEKKNILNIQQLDEICIRILNDWNVKARNKFQHCVPHRSVNVFRLLIDAVSISLIRCRVSSLDFVLLFSVNVNIWAISNATYPPMHTKIFTIALTISKM